MEIKATAQQFASWIAEVLGTEYRQEGNICIFPVGPRDVEKTVELDRLDEIIGNLSEYEKIDDTAICDGHSYEVLVGEASPFPRLAWRMQAVDLADEENGITYRIAPPSDEYLFFLLYEVSQIESLRFLMGYGRTVGRILDRQEDCDLLTLVKSLTSRFTTLRVQSTRMRSAGDLLRYANSLWFHLSYNLDLAVVPRRSLDELLRRGRITSSRRARLPELDAPKRFYIPELTDHYLLAVASDTPPLEYLSYYHIVEYFFEAVFNDDLVERVRSAITEPGFSYKRKTDIQRLIKQIARSLKFRDENVTFSEEEALRLTLARYVDLEILIEELRHYDGSLLEYYRTHTVPFSNGPTIDLEDEDQQCVWQSLARRIYRTRNAIVHTKEGERGRFLPFEHDRALSREIPLLRFIAELVTIGSSSLIT